jgi:uncharacterized protein
MVDKKRRYNIEGGTVLDGFPSTGLVNAIAIECMIQSLKTELVAVLDSPEFPLVSLVSDGCPQFPARIYVNEAMKASFFVSEFDIHPSFQRAVAKIILQWSAKHKCKTIISSTGIIDDQSSSRRFPENSKVYALASNQAARDIITQKGFLHFRTGFISGIPAILLNEGSLTDTDVIVLLVKTATDAPDFQGAALLSEAVSKIVPDIYCDMSFMIKEAELVENNIRLLRDDSSKISPYR